MRIKHTSHWVALRPAHKAHIPLGGRPAHKAHIQLGGCGKRLQRWLRRLPKYGGSGKPLISLTRVACSLVTGFLPSTEEEQMIWTKTSCTEFPSQLGNRHKEDMASYHGMRCKQI